MNSGERNKAAVRACFENASQGNFDALDGIVTSDYVLHPEEIQGVDGLKTMAQRYREALGGLRVTVDQQFAANRQRFLTEQGYSYFIVDADELHADW